MAYPGAASTAGRTEEPDRPVLRALLNVLWLVFSGLWVALVYALAGVICCLLIVTLPWGQAAFRMAGYVLWPFGRAPVPGPEPGPWYDPRNLLWLLVGGIWVLALHVVLGVFFAATLVLFLAAAQHLKMVPIAVNPRHWTIESDLPGATSPHEPATPPPPPVRGFRQ